MVITDYAKSQLRQILYHVRCRLNNPAAARSIKQDLNETKEKLTYLAGSIKLCDNLELAEKGFRVILFRKHRYVLIYKVRGNIAFVEGICHELQNYQNLFK